LKYSAVVVIGGDFRGPNDDGLDARAKARVEAGVSAMRDGEAEWLLVTGSLAHPNTGAHFALQALRLAGRQLESACVYVHPEFRTFSTDTLGDVKQAVEVAEQNQWGSLLVVTERAHWFRVRRFFRKRAPELVVHLRPSATGPWWYWLKEITFMCALLVSGEDSRFYAMVRRAWRRAAPLFLDYVIER